eukprot:1455830-Pyramimonas_sp.AAC.1
MPGDAARQEAEHIWLGGTDFVVEGKWAWVDGSTWSYSNWSPSEPNNYGNEDCLMKYILPHGDMRHGGVWHDRRCQESYYRTYLRFVCKASVREFSEERQIVVPITLPPTLGPEWAPEVE